MTEIFAQNALEETALPLSLVWNGKADGASGGGVAFSIIGDHDNRPTDMTNLIVYENDLRSSE